MSNKICRSKTAVSAFLIWTFALVFVPVRGQDLIPVSDITGGSSVFVFRTSKKAPPKRFVSNAKFIRTKIQRLETVKRVAKQFTVIAKATPRRTRTKTVDPFNMPPNPNTMRKEEAAKVFAGVGEYYIDKEEFDKSIEFFRESLMLEDNKNARTGLSEALALKGNQLLAGEKPEAARRFFEESIEYNPNNAVAFYGLGEVWDDTDKADEAIAGYEKALLLDRDLTEIYVPLGVLYYRKGEIAKADEHLGKALKTSPNDEQAQYFLGLVRFAQNRNDESLKAFREAVKLNNDSAEAHYYAGKSLVRLNLNKEAVVEFEEALRVKPKYFEALFDAGAAYYEMENYAEAVNKYKAATRVKNDNIEAYANLADAYRQVGNFADAESNYNLAITFIQRTKDYSRDETAQIYSYAGYVVGRQCENDIKKYIPCRWSTTIKNLEKALELSPNAADYTNLGWAYYNAGKIDLTYKKEAEGKAKFEQAKLVLQKAVALNPAYIEAPLLNLGVTLIDLGDFAGAIAALKPVVEKRPEWNFSGYALGVAYRKNGDIVNAVSAFRRAVEKEPNYIAALSALGESEYRNKNKKETERIIGRLKALNALNEAKKLEVLVKGAAYGY
ncbi:MAG: Tetratricopeptide repeat family protein [Acidobacteria bacterium]|nr:Tetratricopeptide repeat family protein [Acidobacteriota bacterium]